MTRNAVGPLTCGAVSTFPNRKQGYTVDALVLESDEGRSIAAISVGEVPSNL